MEKLYFRPLKPEDFPLLLQWLSLPHVKQWWDDGDDSLEKVAEHFSSDPDIVRRFILELEHEKLPIPLGYYQYYFEPDSIIGVDQFIGEPSYIGKGYGSRALIQFCAEIVSSQKVNRIIVDPEPENVRAIGCYKKVGFVHQKTYFSEESGKWVYLMALPLTS